LVLPVIQIVQVDVCVDEARHDVIAGQVHFVIALGGARCLVDCVRRADRADLGDAIAREDDVDRTLRRCAGAVDHGDVAQHGALERARAFGARRDGIGDGPRLPDCLPGGGGNRQRKRDCGTQQIATLAGHGFSSM
jgi:hypothetical protein